MNYLIVVLAYLFCHGLTALFVTPMQSKVFPDETVFASLIYLPHGVRVLATWALGWRAIPALALGSGISTWLFSPAEDLNFLEPALIEGILLGACSAFLAFELLRFAGSDFYYGSSKRLDWKGMIMIGALSSVINSIAQTFVYSGLIGFSQLAKVLAFYAVGDLVGLMVCMVALMFIFRWSRLFGKVGD